MNETALCACGCGEETNVGADGRPRRYRRGHNRRGVGKGWLQGGYLYMKRNGKKTPVHRYVMELWLGHTLTSNEVVHHVDGDPTNNDPNNLMILTRSEHSRLHRTRSTRRPWRDEEKARAAELSAAGMTIQQVSDVLGRPFASTRLYTTKTAKESRS
jgi:hypothetical protein